MSSVKMAMARSMADVSGSPSGGTSGIKSSRSVFVKFGSTVIGFLTGSPLRALTW